ncbi:MAG: SHOCT domain-containing protein [Lachnospiraceae bacterium]|nr:SHOCT domain-containing protein [Lachnospiraceae bacterium]MDE6252838.1 SHOCT domain-containing protein [Lachnospiraceae bacterium]
MSVTKTKTKAAIQMCAMIAAISFIVVSIIIILFTAKTKLVITDKRAYGIAGLGKRVDIPIDSISSIGTGIFQSVIIASSSGRIVFAGLSNYNKLHNVISNLLIERQNNSTTPNNNIVDELTKYKELLDSGIISQDEFDAKKKQLLGF